MGIIKPADNIVFADNKLEEEFNSLPENNWLKKAIDKSIYDFKENVFCGERIRKKLIPKEYIKKYGINNLLWYPLPNAWRLIYSVLMKKDEIVAFIIEYFDHKNYERRFKY